MSTTNDYIGVIIVFFLIFIIGIICCIKHCSCCQKVNVQISAPMHEIVEIIEMSEKTELDEIVEISKKNELDEKEEIKI